MTTGQCIRNWQGFARTVSDVAWSPNSAQIASGGNDGLVTIWDVAQHVPLHLLRGHKAIIWGVSWSPDGRWLASCSEDNTIRIWDVAKAVSERVLTDSALVDAQLFATAWSPDGERLAVATHRQGVFVYDMHTQTFQRVGRSDVPPRIRRVEWSPDGRYLAGSGEGGHYSHLEHRRLFLARHACRDIVGWWQPSPGLPTARGSLRAVGDMGATNCLFGTPRAGSGLRALDDPNELVFGVAWSADGERLVSAGSDGILRWWNPQNGECILSRQGHEGPVQSLRPSPDGRLLASCGDDGAIQIWEMDSGEHVSDLAPRSPVRTAQHHRHQGLDRRAKADAADDGRG